MPIPDDILDNKVLGREFRRGLEQGRLLRRLIEERFGAVPPWAKARLVSLPAAQLEEIGVRILKAESLEELLR
jgi:hypothetical protein